MIKLRSAINKRHRAQGARLKVFEDFFGFGPRALSMEQFCREFDTKI
jgi:hypothetical protein